MVSSRDRNCQRRDSVVTLSPGRRRLRFSFQINDVKDLTSELAPPDYARVAARSGVSSRHPGSCQPAQTSPSSFPASRGSSERKIRTGAAEGLPS